MRAPNVRVRSARALLFSCAASSCTVNLRWRAYVGESVVGLRVVGSRVVGAAVVSVGATVVGVGATVVCVVLGTTVLHNADTRCSHR